MLEKVTVSQRWVKRIRERWQEGIRHRVTPLGAMILALLFASGILAFTTLQNVFFLLFSLLLGSILISSFVNRLMLAGLELRLDLPSHAMAGESVSATLFIHNTKTGLPSFALEILAPVNRRFYIPIVQSRGTSQLPVEVVWNHRGQPEPILVELSTRFPFGFSVRRTRVSVPVRGLLYPSIRPKPGFREELDRLVRLTQAAQRAGSEEPDQLRDYQPGDSWRQLAMRPSARAGRWIVRTAQSAVEGALAFTIDPAAADFESTVNLAAYIVWELHAQQITFDLHLPDHIYRVDSPTAAYAALNALALTDVGYFHGYAPPALLHNLNVIRSAAAASDD